MVSPEYEEPHQRNYGQLAFVCAWLFLQSSTLKGWSSPSDNSLDSEVARGSSHTFHIKWDNAVGLSSMGELEISGTHEFCDIRLEPYSQESG